MATLSLAVASLVCAGGCNVQVRNGGNGEDKDVKIATPMGGISVKTNQTDASDLGLPVYPGARIADTDDRDKSANVSMGFGAWRLHVQVVSYKSTDPQDKVAAFYRKALSSYGVVIECIGNKPVGTPAVTGEGLSCVDSDHAQGHVPLKGNELQLKAGSRRHQHIVAFRNRGDSESEAGSEFVLVALDLPRGPESNKHETD